MGKVRLEISPDLAGVLNAESYDWLILERQLGENTTIGDLLADLAFSNADFSRAVYDPHAAKVGDQIMVVLNNSLLQVSNVAAVELKDGDTLLLLPVFSGG